MDKKEPQRSNILAYVDADEIQTVVDGLLAGGESAIPEVVKKLAKTMGEFTSAPDVALFGRMLARKPTTIILDAACQVSHAISTHRASMDMDFFTAMDDLKTDDETGAGMMGVIAFNSACFYRYARIDWEQLVSNLGGDKAALDNCPHTRGGEPALTLFHLDGRRRSLVERLHADAGGDLLGNGLERLRGSRFGPGYHHRFAAIAADPY